CGAGGAVVSRLSRRLGATMALALGRLFFRAGTELGLARRIPPNLHAHARRLDLRFPARHLRRSCYARPHLAGQQEGYRIQESGVSSDGEWGWPSLKSRATCESELPDS